MSINVEGVERKVWDLKNIYIYIFTNDFSVLHERKNFYVVKTSRFHFIYGIRWNKYSRKFVNMEKLSRNIFLWYIVQTRRLTKYISPTLRVVNHRSLPTKEKQTKKKRIREYFPWKLHSSQISSNIVVWFSVSSSPSDVIDEVSFTA